MRCFILTVLLLNTAVMLHAQLSPDYDHCRIRAGRNAVQLNACDVSELGRQDARLNRVYQKLSSQLSDDPDAKLKLRDTERAWLKSRDLDCKVASSRVDNKCLLDRTADRANVLEKQSPATPVKGPIPKELWGEWIITRQLPTSTIGCWGQKEADAIIGTKLEYDAHSFRWKNLTAKNVSATQGMISASEFGTENSGGGPNDSRVSFGQLGINASSVEQIGIIHPDVTSITEATTEIPGDSVLMKDPNTIVFSVCNVYFEAKRNGSPALR